MKHLCRPEVGADEVYGLTHQVLGWDVETE
jgi:hypothetical protein